MTESGSISLLLSQLRAGDEPVLFELHQRCWPWLVKMARQRLGGQPLRWTDEEDVAQVAFFGFVTSVREGRVPQMESRHQLFALLTHIVACKAATQIERHLAEKRGGGQVGGESVLDALVANRSTSTVGGIQSAASGNRTPDEEAALADCYQFYIGALPDALRPFAELHVAGATNSEIAVKLGCVGRTVERKLALIRARWQEMAATELSRV